MINNKEKNKETIQWRTPPNHKAFIWRNFGIISTNIYALLGIIIFLVCLVPFQFGLYIMIAKIPLILYLIFLLLCLKVSFKSRFLLRKKCYLSNNYLKINGFKKKFKAIAGYEIKVIDEVTCLYVYLKNSWVLKSILPSDQSVAEIREYFSEHKIPDITNQEKPKELSPVFCLGLFVTLVSLSYWLCLALFHFTDISVRTRSFSYDFRSIFIFGIGAILFIFRTKFFHRISSKRQTLIGLFLLVIPFAIFSVQFFHKPIFTLEDAVQPALQAEESSKAWLDFMELPNLKGYDSWRRITNKVERLAISKQKWRDSEKLRKAWLALDQFEGIADNPLTANNDKFYEKNSNPRVVPAVFYEQALVDLDNSNLVSAIENVDAAYSVVRKIYPYKISPWKKINFCSQMGACVDRYNEIIDSPLCTASILTNIYNQLPVLTDQERDLYTSQMGNVILLDNLMKSMQPFIMQNNIVYDSRQSIYWDQSSIKKYLTSISQPAPDFQKQPEPVEQIYVFYNLMGGIFRGMFVPNCSLITDTFKVYVRHDLLNLKLAYKLGKKLELKDPFTGQPYHFDAENLAYRSAGLDQKYFTEDDIVLEIEPKL